MKHYTRILSILMLALLTIVMPATAQTDDNKNKAIVETTDGTQQLNTDDISVIRFDSGKITIEQPWGNTTYDRTLRSLSFFRPLPGTLRLTATTDINANDGGNRAQVIDGGGKLKSTWESGDVVYVYADASSTSSIGTLTPTTIGASTATLTGDINADDLSNGQTLYFSTKDRATFDLTSQDGTVESLFYFTATAEITIDGGNATIADMTFERPIAVVKFSLKDKGNSDAAISASELQVTVNNTIYTVTPSSATDVLYVGIPGISSKAIILDAAVGDKAYVYNKSGVSFTNNEYYAITVKMTEYAPNTTPLTFQAMADDVTVKLHKFQTAQPSLQYRKNDGDWTTLTFVDTYNSTSISLNTGDKLSFRGNNTTLTEDQNGYCKFELSGNCYVYGNIMSLLDKDDFPTNKTLSAGFTFYQLFLGAPIYNHPSKTLVLPATTLAASCYSDMFAGCTHLTTAPALPAATLANACYKNMFRGCTGLTTAPTLSATTLANECYRNMFGGCTGLTTAPTLQAESLANECYEEMFSGCTGLTTAPNLPAKTAAEYCYYYMFEGCTALATAPVLSATTMASHCYYAMFKGCTSLTTAPDLPATTLASYCYANMFLNCTGLTTAPTILPATTLVANCYRSMFDGCKELTTAPVLPAATLQYYCYAWMFDGCKKLNNVTCLATNISADDCTYYWLNGVAATGTFTKAASMTGWTSGASGIPSDWTVKNAVPTGALGGKFTVNAGSGQVSFSQGNLQYQASTSTWRFATNQYNFVGNATVGNVYENETKCNNASIGGSYSGWIDLFGWGTGNNPTNSSTNNNDYGTFTDWGVNAISNGGNTADLWRTLSKDEWGYLFNTRTNAANLRTFATVNGVVGLILMPDGWTADGVSLTITTANYTSNIISLANWNTLESQGCVFLPSAGYRGGTTLDLVQDHGSYWSNTAYNSNHAYYLDVKTNGLDPHYENNRYTGLSVRLVYETPFQGAGTESDPYLISSEADWIILANKVNSGNSFTGKFFRQTANINVTTMVGNSSDSKPFSGTYDGDGKTLNLSLNTLTPHTAPFRFIENATIKNVVTTGSVHSADNHPSGLVGETDGTCTIQNCRVGASVGGAQHSGGIVGHCWHANISIIGCVYSGTLTPASGQWTGGIIGWGGDGGGHTISISDCLFAGTLTGSTKFHPIGILQNQSNTKYLSNTYYTLGAQNTNDDASFVNGLSYKGKFAHSITAGTGVTVARTGATAVYDVSGITSYGTGILYDGVLYAGNGEEVSLSLSPGETPTGSTFRQYTVTGGGSLDNPTSNSPTLTMTDANQTIGAEWE